ncbi:hypothetical protein PVK06_019367 [Gossypium arboreum]|uniref:Uncharacterized protein n=1 Tax=Gossypium arboreum TaxID=29729 RepID=A0ABR0PJU8_GOSAR|nr:hypothetical protein PVK06_019367 [Gossypium arboreum]
MNGKKNNVEEQELVKIQFMKLGEVVVLKLKLANMDPVLERSKSLKQLKLTTSFLKNEKAKLGKTMSKLILHEALPARIAESPFLQPVLQVAAEVGKSVTGPSAYEVTGVYLEKEYKEIQE